MKSYKPKISRFVLIGLALTLAAGITTAEGINVYGFFQTQGLYTLGYEPNEYSRSSFAVQELDLYFQKNITTNVSALIDVQLLTNFSSIEEWGGLNLDEAWVKFSPYRILNIRIGHIVPTFNNFNEIKSKFPLFPYIIRPLIYETYLSSKMHSDQYLPQHAAIQINGTAAIGNSKIDYAVFGGNSDFTAGGNIPKSSDITISGMDSTNFKLFGGRIGFRMSGIKFGVSGTYDVTRNDAINERVSTANAQLPESMQVPVLGEMPRNRLGLDLSYTNYGISFESEYILVKRNPDSQEKKNLDAIIKGTSMRAGSLPDGTPIMVKTLGNDLTQHFFYVNLTYDFLQRYFVTAGYTYKQDNSEVVISSEGLSGIMGGLGYRVNDFTTIKFQASKFGNNLFKDAETLQEFSFAFISAAVSVFF